MIIIILMMIVIILMIMMMVILTTVIIIIVITIRGRSREAAVRERGGVVYKAEQVFYHPS